MRRKARSIVAAGVLGVIIAAHGSSPNAQEQEQEQGFKFKSATELVNITATVSDFSGRFVKGLRREDFRVYEDDRLQTVSQFGAERVPVSLGIVVDTSESMAGDKMRAARTALDQFFDLLGKDDEIFLYRFSDQPALVQGWTNDRRQLSKALGRLTPSGATAMYDGVADAIRLAEHGHNQKKALVVISDGNDNSSHTSVERLKQMIRESEVLVYAIGVDGESEPGTIRRMPLPGPRPFPMPMPFPRGRGRGWPLTGPLFLQGFPRVGGYPPGPRGDRVNPTALRELTDDSGGRTEIITEIKDLSRATAAIADELSQQYYLGYLANGEKDGRWHSIRVEITTGSYKVRARGGYVAD